MDSKKLKKTDRKNHEKDRLLLTMSRIDHYYDSVNNKSAVYIAINTFLTGGLIAVIFKPELLGNLQCLEIWCIAISLFLGVVSLILLAYTSIPFFSTKPDSLIYFGSISKKSIEEFSALSKKYEEHEELKDLRNQVHILSKGLTKKFKWLRIVGIILVGEFLALFPIIYFLIKTYNQ